MSQLDLFADETSSKVGTWTPVKHRRRHIVNVARNLLAREGERRQKRWRLERNRLDAAMIAAGIRDRVVIQAEIQSFHAAVEAEMGRQVQKPQQPAELVAFPAARMRGAMRDAAADVLAMPKHRQQLLLDHEVELLRRRLVRQRFTPAEIRKHVTDFREGILAEMRRIVIISIIRSERGDTA